MKGDALPKKSLGQHWLDDADSLRAMVDAAGVSGADTVLEIGPGLGTLTSFLLERANRVVAVEFDHHLAANLVKNIQDHKIQHSEVRPLKSGKDDLISRMTVVEADILRFDLTTLPAGYKVVANIPYYLTSNLIRVLSESSNPPSMAALLVQKEVAERVAAGPGAMSILSVTAQFYWEVSLGRVVVAELFTPPPKVDSQILILKFRNQPLFPDVEPQQFFRIIKAGFSQRRKTLLNSLSSGLHLDRLATERWLQTADITPNARAQSLSLDEWHELYKKFEACDSSSSTRSGIQ